MTTSSPQQVIAAIWRMESAKIIAVLTRMVRDVAVAEELAQDALVAALERWPTTGVPDNAAAWLMQTAKHKAIDRLRRGSMTERKRDQVEHDTAVAHEERAAVDEEVERKLDDDVGDDLLKLMFSACHPVLGTDARVALTLRLVGGLTTEEIARGFLVPEATVAQRIVRAKKTLSDKKIAFEVPEKAELEERLASVLEVIYLVFNEGYSATAGDDWMRPQLCEDALRLGRVLAGLAPEHAEVHGLVALMEIQASRIGARTDGAGNPILLLEQDRGRWNRLLISRGLNALARAESTAHAAGPYELQAAIAACHARAATADATDWARIASLYAELASVAPSPVVELNRAVAVAMAEGPAAGLAIADALVDDPALAQYHLLPSVRADFLHKLGRTAEAQAEWRRAASLTKNERERALLLARATHA